MLPEVSPAPARPALTNLRSTPVGWPHPGGSSALDTDTAPARGDGGRVDVVRAGRERGFRRVLSPLADIVTLVAVAWAVPLVILAIGIPIALFVRLVMWIVGVI